MARIRRRPAVVWLPNAGEPLISDDGTLVTFVHDVGPGAAGRVVSVHKLTSDQPAETSLVDGGFPTLSDFEGSAYRLRRIVGKCFTSCAQSEPAGSGITPVVFYLTAGFIVLRVDPLTGEPANEAQADAFYNPQNFGSERDPWIWRRTWLISNNNDAIGSSLAASYPTSNVEYGSVADGPHIDAKTARRVSDEERLFFVAASQGVESFGTGQPNNTAAVRWFLDYRLLASMLKNSGNRRNASR